MDSCRLVQQHLWFASSSHSHILSSGPLAVCRAAASQYDMHIHEAPSILCEDQATHGALDSSLAMTTYNTSHPIKCHTHLIEQSQCQALSTYTVVHAEYALMHQPFVNVHDALQPNHEPCITTAHSHMPQPLSPKTQGVWLGQHY